MTDFDPRAVRAFRFLDCRFDPATGEAGLDYALDDGPVLTEVLRFPGAPFALDAARAAAVGRALRLLHLVAGVSYYKAAVPPEIRIEAYDIDADTAALLGTIYENGLGEFAYRNGLSLRGKVRFPVGPSGLKALPQVAGVAVPSAPTPPVAGSPGPTPPVAVPSAPTPPVAVPLGPTPAVGGPSGPTPPVGGRSGPTPPVGGPSGPTPGAAPALGLREHAIVAIGGGKDSLVSIEALREAGVAQTVAWIGGSPLIAACAARTGLPTMNIGRQIAPGLFELNRRGALNGHIPVTAVNSAILAVAALLHGVDQVVFSNERSASYGSLIPGSGEVNHQWSKGWDFEQGFAAHLRSHVAADLRYYSLLRPFSELAVARRFARLEGYDAFFSSCNRNFHILGERPAQRWCGACPKCHFVFLALAPFMPKPRLVAIFGRNLLDEPEQAPGFDALMEFRDHKPFECVGEGRESRAAMEALADAPAWREDALVRRYAREIRPLLDGSQRGLAPLLEPSDDHGIPSALWERLRANFGA